MNCEGFEARLQDLLDRRASIEGDEELSAHAANCESCRRELGLTSVLLEAVAQMPRPEPRPDLVARVLADVAVPQDERSEFSRPAMSRLAVYLFAVAAALLVAAFPVYLLWTGDDGAPAIAEVDDATPTTVAEGSVAAPGENQEQTDPPIGDLAREVGDRYASLVSETQESYAELALLLPGVRPRKAASADEAAPPTDVSSRPRVASRGWVDDMTEGLKPVTTSTAGAFSFLLEALPSEVPGEKS